jgi:acetylornithine deacetylase/succinyl-diaminopimelate desuccinylase-like protein
MRKKNTSNLALDLTKELISIPSFVESENGLVVDETRLAEFLIKYIEVNLPWLKVFKEQIKGTRRFNVIAYNSTQPKVIFVSHMDTVKPNGDSIVRLTPMVKDGRLFGLGSVDMKAGLACSLIAAQLSDSKTPIAMVFDCDEEYYFAGIGQFINDYMNGKLPLDNKSKPELVIFPEPSDLRIVAGCRGCVEITFRVIGKTAHAGKPDQGINAIEKGVELVGLLKKSLADDCANDVGSSLGDSNPLGQTTINLAGLNGGVLQNGQVKLQANAISDVADLLLDIRTAQPEQTAEYILKKIQIIAKVLKIKVVDMRVNLDLGSYLNTGNELKILEQAMQKVVGKVDRKKDLSNSGYGEIALLGERLAWNTANFGPGLGSTSHTIDEALNIEDLDVVVDVYSEVIKLLGKKL